MWFKMTAVINTIVAQKRTPPRFLIKRGVYLFQTLFLNSMTLRRLVGAVFSSTADRNKWDKANKTYQLAVQGYLHLP